MFGDAENKYDTYCRPAGLRYSALAAYYSRTIQYRIIGLIHSSHNAFSALIETDAHDRGRVR